jgi:hypothetical protein
VIAIRQFGFDIGFYKRCLSSADFLDFSKDEIFLIACFSNRFDLKAGLLGSGFGDFDA